MVKRCYMCKNAAPFNYTLLYCRVYNKYVSYEKISENCEMFKERKGRR